jgi:hypothetical protein
LTFLNRKISLLDMHEHSMPIFNSALHVPHIRDQWPLPIQLLERSFVPASRILSQGSGSAQVVEIFVCLSISNGANYSTWIHTLDLSNQSVRTQNKRGSCSSLRVYWSASLSNIKRLGEKDAGFRMRGREASLSFTIHRSIILGLKMYIWCAERKGGKARQFS